MYLNLRIFSNAVMYINLTFIQPCTVIYFYSKSNKIVPMSQIILFLKNTKCLNLFYFWKKKHYMSQFIFSWKTLYLSQFILFLKNTLQCLNLFYFWKKNSTCLNLFYSWKDSRVSIYFLFEKHSICLNLFYFRKTLYMSQFVLYLKNTLQCLNLFYSWKKLSCLNLFYFWKKLSGLNLYYFLKTLYISVWHMSVAVCTVVISWWWTERPSETCRAFLKNKINWDIGASCWICYGNIMYVNLAMFRNLVTWCHVIICS